jgi:preprotein translocase SecE subunit
MALGIYKSGQGYWVRVLTASMIGVVTLATAAFAWRQGELLVERVIPKSQASMSLQLESGTPAAGQVLDLLADGARPGEKVKIGTGEVISYSVDQRAALLHNFTLEPERFPADAKRVSAGTAGEAGAVSGLVTGVTLRSPIEPLYVQGGLAGVIILIGSVIGFWLTATRPRTVDFLVATDFEMKKVNWSTPREIIGSTYVVIGACVIIGGSLFIFDFLFKTFFQGIGVLAG